MRKSLLSGMMLILLSANLFASGFQINENGARAMGMANAFTGLANDASAVFFNPAGMTQLKGTNFSAGVSLIAPMTKFTGPNQAKDEYKLKSNVFTPFTLYISHQLTDDIFVGLSVNNPYGLGTEWNSDWAGRYLAVDTEIRTFNFQPTIAYKFNEHFSIGFGFSIAYGDVKIKKNLPLADPFTGAVSPDASSLLEGDGTSFGFNIGFLWKPIDEFSLGVDYRSKNKYTFEGTATTNPPTFTITHPLAGPIPVKLPYGNVEAPLTTPENLVIGLAYKPNKTLTIAADFQYVGWKSYDKLEVTFKDYVVNTSTGSKVSSSYRGFKNSYIARVGSEYLYSNELALRFGLLYDKNPVEDELVEPTLPDADRIGITAGFGYKLTECLSIDVSYFYLHFMEREITNSVNTTVPGKPSLGYFNGTYKPVAHLFAVSFNYTL
ncbi:MAG TPA: outer membrane protein transport protein [Melioribacteraceae bacterium]|nr:outer membrane protein transport protein [Melioribacteraceae bacterium]